jgi:SOS-response transcriptional repressor LexA/DNA-binding Xre family transcriptional regulator
MGKLNERIKKQRLAHSLTLLQVAEHIGVKEATVQRYESGEIKNIKHETILGLAKLFGCSPQYLMGWSDDPYDYDSDPEGRMNSIDQHKYEQLYEKHHGFKPKIWEEAWDDAAAAFAERVSSDPSDGIDDYLASKGIIPVPHVVKKPLIGTISCGQPILAVENFDGYVDIPDDIHCDFALKCKGDSMIGAFIRNGDIVYIRQQPDVENHEIAAVIIDEENVTLKRVHKKGHFLILLAENPAFEPIIVNGEHTARIIGKVVGFTSVVK